MRPIPPDLQRHSERMRQELEAPYLRFPDTEPWRQSGMSGPMDRWTSLRKPIADCITRDGDLLDLCCANGFLLECIVKWTAERGITVTPYGLDISERLIEAARTRLPQHRHRLFVGNAFAWIPPKRMDYVSTLLGLFPKEYEDEFVAFVIQNHLKDGGSLLIHETGARGEAEKNLRDTIALSRFNQVGHRTGYDPVKDREVYVAILMR